MPAQRRNIHICIWDLSCSQSCYQVLELEGADTEGSQQCYRVFQTEEWKNWHVSPVRNINLSRWKICCCEQPTAKICRAKQHHSAHLGKTVGKADECLKLWGSRPARNKLFPCRKVPGEVVKSCSVILNQKSQCLLILAQLQQNHHNSFLCGLRWKK